MPALSTSKPSVTVQVDRPRQIRFNWAAVNRFEEQFGKSIPEALNAPISVRLITALTWSGMLHEEPALTMREVERRIQGFINQDFNINQLSEDLLKALVASGVLGKSAPVEETPAEVPNEPAVPQE